MTYNKFTVHVNNLFLNLLTGVSEENGRGGVTGAHLRLRALESWEEG